MFTFLIDRKGSLHIIDFKSYTGQYNLACRKIYNYKDNVISLASDNTFNGLCLKCLNYYNTYNNKFQHTLDYNTYYYYLLDANKNEFLGPKNKYDLPFNRIWSKLSKAKSSAKKSKYYGK